jgi:hypothetical protein
MIAVLYQLVDREPNVRERGDQRARELFEVFRASPPSTSGATQCTFTSAVKN